MDKLRMGSPDLTAENIEKIGALFPNCITEKLDEEHSTKEHKVYKKAVNFELLKQMLSPDVVDGDECYEFTWVGKKAAIVEANKPIRKTLRPCPEESKDWDTTENLYIEGDNLEVLKLLQESYLGKIKMIYIDPPYNTGSDSFVYPDNYSMSREEYEEQMGIYDDDENMLFRENNDSNPRFHSDWCSMMYSRLMLARNLLTEDGLIMVSIDDNELENLKSICNEIFGKDNFVDNIIWKKRYGGGAKEKYLVTLQEYILIYCKNISQLNEIFVPLSAESADRYYGKRDEKYAIRGGYRTHPLEAGKAMDSRPNLVYPIPAPDGSEIMPKRQWLWSKERTYEALKNNDLEIVRGKDGGWVVSSKQYLKDENGTMRPGKMFSVIDDIYTQHGTNEMISIFGNAKVFSYPKPSELIRKLINICGLGGDFTILDFFSGASSTAHAVIQANADDNGHRKFIMVQLPELCDEQSEAFKAGYKNICEIGKERIRRAGEKIKAESPLTTADLDVGFRVFKLDDSNMKDVYYAADEFDQQSLAEMVSNIKDDRTALDLFFGCLLDWGLPLSMPYHSEKLEGCTVHTYNNGDLIACFDTNIPESVVREIARRKPVRAVFRDDGFADSPAKINVFEIFKYYMPEDAADIGKRVKVI